MLNVDIKVFRAHVKAGDIKYVKVGQRRKYALDDLDDFIKRKTGVECPYSKTPKPPTGSTSSKSEVIDFEGQRAQRQKLLRRKLRPPSAIKPSPK